MPDSSEEKQTPQKIFKYSWILVAVGVLIVAGIFFSRWQENRAIEAKAAAKAREHARQVAEALGGSNFEILNFYASPGAIHRGDSAELCYGVSNAKTVEIQPPVPEDTWASLSRCISVEPTKTTTYTLTASNAKGEKKTATLTLTVQ